MSYNRIAQVHPAWHTRIGCSCKRPILACIDCLEKLQNDEERYRIEVGRLRRMSASSVPGAYMAEGAKAERERIVRDIRSVAATFRADGDLRVANVLEANAGFYERGEHEEKP